MANFTGYSNVVQVNTGGTTPAAAWPNGPITATYSQDIIWVDCAGLRNAGAGSFPEIYCEFSRTSDFSVIDQTEHITWPAASNSNQEGYVYLFFWEPDDKGVLYYVRMRAADSVDEPQH